MDHSNGQPGPVVAMSAAAPAAPVPPHPGGHSGSCSLVRSDHAIQILYGDHALGRQRHDCRGARQPRHPGWRRLLRSGRIVLTVLSLSAIPLATLVAGIRIGSAEPVAALIAAADGDTRPAPRRLPMPPVVIAPEPFIPAQILKGRAPPRLHLHTRT